jgi:hypothetical protein
MLPCSGYYLSDMYVLVLEIRTVRPCSCLIPSSKVVKATLNCGPQTSIKFMIRSIHIVDVTQNMRPPSSVRPFHLSLQHK